MSTQEFEIGRAPRTIVGAGALGALRGAVESLGSGHAVLVVDAAVVGLGYAERVVQALAGVPTTVHVIPAGEPTVASVDAAADVVRRAPSPVVIGVGGGSALDTAKQAAVVAPGESGVEPYLLCATPLPGRRPIIAVPTTSGTGAEVTRTCILSDHDGRKLWTWGDEMLPDVVVLDPTAAASMPHAVTVGTGLDAFVHALEACSGARRNSLSAASAQRALRLVVDHLPRAAADGSDLAARQGMQEAAYLAGLAIDGCGTGVAHAIGHALGSLYHVPHGVSVAVGLQAALAWNVEGDPAAFADAADALGAAVDEVPGVFADLVQRTDLGAVVRTIASASAAAGAPWDPDAVGEAMAAPENQPMLHNNARAVDDGARHALAGRTVALWQELAAP